MPNDTIPWLAWSPKTLERMRAEPRPTLLFVEDPENGLVAPFLRAILEEMEAHDGLRALLSEWAWPLKVRAKGIDDFLAAMGAGKDYHVCITPSGQLTPLVVVDTVTGDPAATVAEIFRALKELKKVP